MTARCSKTDLQPTGQSGGYALDKHTPAGISRLSRLSTLPAKPVTASSLFFTPAIDTESRRVNNVILRGNIENYNHLFLAFQSIQQAKKKKKVMLSFDAVLVFYTKTFLFHSPLVFCIIGGPRPSHWSPLFWQCVCCASQGSPPAAAALSVLCRPAARDAPPEVSSDERRWFSVSCRALTPGAEWTEHKQISTAGGEERRRRETKGHIWQRERERERYWRPQEKRAWTELGRTAWGTCLRGSRSKEVSLASKDNYTLLRLALIFIILTNILFADLIAGIWK